MDKNAKYCHGKDIFERMNYLYQASYLMALKNRVAASYYGNIMVGCAKKSVLRIESDIKRTVCKCCQSPLIPGETAKVRLVSKPVKAVKYTCLTCLSVKRYPMKKGYKLWSEQPESVIQNLNYASIPGKKRESNVNVGKSDSNETAKSAISMEIDKN